MNLFVCVFVCLRERDVLFPLNINTFQEVQFPVDELRIEVDCSVSRDYVEIDAVEIIGGILFNSFLKPAIACICI